MSGGRFGPRLGADQIRDITTAYQAGAKIGDLADDYGVTPAAIRYQLRAHAVDTRDDRRHNTPPTDDTPDNDDGLAALAAAIAPGPWVDDALCAQVDGEIFFPEQGGSTRQARQTCLRCPVTEQCLAYALANDEHFGVWGGLSERERRRLARGQPLPDRTKTCAVCGDEFHADRGDRVYCSSTCQDQARRSRSQQRTQHRRTA